MSSTKEYRDFILEQLKKAGEITFRAMMGEYMFYSEGVYFGGVFDDRFLVKITATNECFNLEKALPYEGAKPMYLVENLEDEEYLTSLVSATVRGLRKK